MPATLSRRKQKKKVKKKSRDGKPRMADTVDRHVLYQQAVQCVEDEIDFVDTTFRRLRRRRATVIREDFCGTANTSCEWVRRRKENRAIGVDIDPDVLAWGREHNLSALKGDGASRVTLLNEDVLTVRTEKVDAVLAMNFSYWLFKERRTMRKYFEQLRDTLVDDGILFLDAYGGYDAHRELEEPRECEGFDYVWDQHTFDPVSGDMECRIHFEFPDGSKLKNAFTYHWRLWTLPELRELLEEAGFKRVRIFWEGADDDTGEGNGEFEEVTRGEADPGWIAYLVAEK